jgi:hypothetical protein
VAEAKQGGAPPTQPFFNKGLETPPWSIETVKAIVFLQPQLKKKGKKYTGQTPIKNASGHKAKPNRFPFNFPATQLKKDEPSTI